ncbi:hypothetical protein BH23ACI1_BH23ACI1_29780 [soil metagenome]
MPNCFVVMGYGEKTDPHQNKTFNRLSTRSATRDRHPGLRARLPAPARLLQRDQFRLPAQRQGGLQLQHGATTPLPIAVRRAASASACSRPATNLATGVRGESDRKKAEQEYWIRATRAEALAGLGWADEAAAAFDRAQRVKPAPEGWMIDSTREQLEKVTTLLKA